jgi:hypothetical protein
MTLSVNAPQLENEPAASVELATQLWYAAIAPAISILTSCYQVDTYLWKMAALPVTTLPPTMRGIRTAIGTPRARTPVWVLHTDGDDNYSRRRFFWPSAPRGWIEDTKLNPEGAARMLDLARGMFAGLTGTIQGNPLGWLLMYPDEIQGPLAALRAPGFRPVSWVRVCSYTVPAPEPSLAL